MCIIICKRDSERLRERKKKREREKRNTLLI